MKNILFIIGVLLAMWSCENTQAYKFAVICDTRSDADNNGKNGVNVAAIKAVSSHLIKSGAEFIIAPGDFICGNVTWYNESETPPSNYLQYKAFLEAVQSQGVSLPGGNGKIIIYPVRGNHECYQNIESEQKIKRAWIKNIGNRLPKNGPDNEMGFTYSFSYNGDLFIGLDQYIYSDSTKQAGITLNQDWLNGELESNPSAKNVFTFGHTPAFAAQHQDCLGEDSVARNKFLQSITGRSGVYFCGHDHFYNRAKVPVYNQVGKIEDYMQQIITPSGAPFLGGFSPKWDGQYKNKDVKMESYIDNAVGYQLVTVGEDKITVEFIATNDACTFTQDSTGKYSYAYNDNWETWKFETMDDFSILLNK